MSIRPFVVRFPDRLRLLGRHVRTNRCRTITHRFDAALQFVGLGLSVTGQRQAVKAFGKLTKECIRFNSAFPTNEDSRCLALHLAFPVPQCGRRCPSHAQRTILLTGSQKFTLMKNVSETLAGQADIGTGNALFSEIREALPRTELETAIASGGFPELYANPDIDSVAFYNSYLATYLECDVRALANVGSVRDFERFLRALRSANLLNKADLARDAGIAPSTANQWLSVLESPARPCCLNHGSLIEPSPSSRAPSSTLPTQACFAPC